MHISRGRRLLDRRTHTDIDTLMLSFLDLFLCSVYVPLALFLALLPYQQLKELKKMKFHTV